MGTFILVILVPIEALVPTGIIFLFKSNDRTDQRFGLFDELGNFWAVLLLISNIIPPATTAISGYLTDVLIANINQKLIENPLKSKFRSF